MTIRGFEHEYMPAPTEGAPTLLLLHGTGGNEHDLLGLGEALLPSAARLSPRGPVLENGMARYFRRLSEGVFDLEDVQKRSADLAAFVEEASESYGFDPKRVFAVGYSNGANIAASLLLLHPGVLAGAALFHAMVPIVPERLPNLHGLPVFMGSGRQDTMIPPAQAEELGRMLESAGAEVTAHWEPGGHALNRQEVAAAVEWIAEATDAAGIEQQGPM